MDDLDLFSNKDLAQNRKGREHGRKCGRTIHNPMRQMINFEPVGEVANARPAGIRFAVCMRYNNYPMSSIDEFLSKQTDQLRAFQRLTTAENHSLERDSELVSTKACHVGSKDVFTRLERELPTYGRKLVDVTFDSTRLRVKEIGDHPAATVRKLVL